MESGEVQDLGNEEYGVSQEEMAEMEKDSDLVTDEESQKETEDKSKNLIEITPFMNPETIKEGKTKEHRLTTGEVVKPIGFTYKPMTDMQRVKYAETMRRAGDIAKMREVTYSALAKHVLTIEIEDFKPRQKLRWNYIHPADVIEDIIDAITGHVETDKADLKNLLTGLSS